MASRPPTVEPHVERPGPAEFRDPLVRREMQKAAVWFGIGLVILGIITRSDSRSSLLLEERFLRCSSMAERVFSAVFLPLPRPWRLLLVLILGFGFIGWVIWFAGTTIGAQFEALRTVVTQEFDRLMRFRLVLGPHRRKAGHLAKRDSGKHRSSDHRGRNRDRRSCEHSCNARHRDFLSLRT